MRKHDARKLDHATLEALRERAVQRVQEGPEVVARVFGIGRTAIYRWLAEYRRGGWGAEIAATVHAEYADLLQAPVQRVAAPFTPLPFSPPLEEAFVPSADKIIRAARRTLAGKGRA